MTGSGDPRDRYVALARGRAAAPGGAGGWAAALRRAALDAFAAAGFPTTRQEAWRHTNVAPVLAVPYRPDGDTGRNGIDREAIERYTFEPWDCSHLVFINGRYSPGLSRLRRLPEGVVVTSLAEAIVRRRDLVEPHLGRVVAAAGRPFAALNTAMLEDGAFVHVPDRVAVPEDIHLLHVSSPRGGPTVSWPRTLVVAGAGSQVAVVESFVSHGAPGPGFTSPVTEIVVGDGAVVDHHRIQREGEKTSHIANTAARVGRNGSFGSWNIGLGGALTRNDLDCLLDGEGAQCRLDGLYVGTGSQHVDNHTCIDHARPRCSSQEFYKGVLDGRARGVFDGRIIVRPDAQKTDARQINRNLILSEDALVDTKPQLEIFADDVKCTHGATVGQLEDDALFYLRSRAIGLEMARNLLIQAFMSEVLHRIRIDAIRAGLECLLYTRMPHGHRAEGCV
jgi:Fe-S cluster assembly protein SufD